MEMKRQKKCLTLKLVNSQTKGQKTHQESRGPAT